MKLTANLKSWAVGNLDVDEDSDDTTFKKSIGLALAEERLSMDKFTELAADAGAEEANEFTKSMNRLANGIEALLKQSNGENGHDGEKGSKEGMACPKCKKKMEYNEKKGQYTCKGCGHQMLDNPPKDSKPDGTKGTETGNKGYVSELSKAVCRMSGTSFGIGDEDQVEVRYREAAKQYSDNNKSAMLYPSQTKGGKSHPLSGQPVIDFAEGGRPIQSTSQLEKAVVGAYSKFMISTRQRGGSRKFGFQALNQHDQELILYGLENMDWVGYSGDGGDPTFSDIDGKLTPSLQKAIIDESGGSGGLEAVPIVFDDEVIQAPLLHGELFPLVKTKTLDRGRRVEGVSTGKVTGSWGGIDDTAISLFNTNSYVSAFDTTIFRWEGAIRIGLDFLSDSPIDFGAHVTEQYGERLLEDLDDVIAAGNGTTQPEGISVKSGTTSVAFSGTTSLGNYESLRFGVPKQEHRPNLRSSIVFVGTETSYQRARAIPVGASDARRLGGMDYDSYSWMERPYKINESLTNSQIFYAVLGRYRMYRRRGLVIRTSQEGDTLIRNNELLIVALARYGGQLERGSTAAVTTDAPA